MNLDKLVGPETAAPSGCNRVSIAGLTADSREVRPGWLFAALRGSKADGSRFVAEAVAKGAAAVGRGRGAGGGGRVRASGGRGAPPLVVLLRGVPAARGGWGVGAALCCS